MYQTKLHSIRKLRTLVRSLNGQMKGWKTKRSTMTLVMNMWLRMLTKLIPKLISRRIKANAKKILRKDAPARQAWIKERQASDAQAIQTFNFLSDGESEDYKMFMQVKASPLYKPLVDHLPNSNFALGLMVEGLKAVKARQANPSPKTQETICSQCKR